MWFKIMSDLSIGLVILLSLLGSGVYYFWKFDSGAALHSNINTLQDDLEKTKQEIQTLKDKKSNLQALGRDINQVAQDIRQLYNYIPNELTSSQVLKHLNELTKVSGVHMEDIKNLGAVKKKAFYEKLKFSMIIRGFFSEIMTFLSSLTKLKVVITVEAFTIEYSSQQNAQAGFLNELKMNMDIYGYRYVAQNKEQQP